MKFFFFLLFFFLLQKIIYCSTIIKICFCTKLFKCLFENYLFQKFKRYSDLKCGQILQRGNFIFHKVISKLQTCKLICSGDPGSVITLPSIIGATQTKVQTLLEQSYVVKMCLLQHDVVSFSTSISCCVLQFEHKDFDLIKMRNKFERFQNEK